MSEKQKFDLDNLDQYVDRKIKFTKEQICCGSVCAEAGTKAKITGHKKYRDEYFFATDKMGWIGYVLANVNECELV